MKLPMEFATLNDGYKIPKLGLGVFKVENDVASDVVKEAINAGIQLIDTAQAYKNEAGVGDGIARSEAERENLFITTKVRNGEQGFDSTVRSLYNSIKLLRLDYLDLVLVHWPVPMRGKYIETYQALEKLKSDGLIRSIGVSNFEQPHLTHLLDTCGTVPSLNQVEIHPYFNNRELISFCQERGIAVQAWSPLGKATVLADDTIREIAKQTGRTPAQVVLRWHYQNGVLTIPKSVHTERILENADVFSFSLSAEQMDAIDALDKGQRTGPDPAVFNND